MRHLVLFISTALVTGCTAVGPDYTPPNIALPAFFVGGDGAPIGNAAASAWWRSFDDPILNDLVNRALVQNIDIRTAVERINAAEARLAATGLNAQLSGDVSAQVRRSGGELVPTETTTTTGFNGAYVFDLFGGVRRGEEQAVASLQASQYDVGVARLAVLTALTNAYIDARYFQEARALTAQNITSLRETLALVNQQREAGVSNDLAVAQAQAQLDNSLAGLPGLEAGFNNSVFRIATLLAEPAAPLRARLQAGAPQPSAPSSTTGTPADLLRARPDILAAERRFAAAVADIGVAEARLYPSLSLTGNITLSDPSSWSFTQGLVLPVLNQGALAANRDATISAAEQAEFAWRAEVLGAVEDVQIAQSNLSSENREIAALRNVLVSNERVVDLSRITYEAGETSIFDLLDAERTKASARVTLAAARRDAASAWVALQVSIGRGWVQLRDDTG